VKEFKEICPFSIPSTALIYHMATNSIPGRGPSKNKMFNRTRSQSRWDNTLPRYSDPWPALVA
jgi:hypothetical protein